MKCIIFLFLIFFFGEVSFSQSHIWVKELETSSQNQGSLRILNIETDSQSNIFIAGVFNDTLDIDPGPSFQYLISNDYWDVFVAKLDSNGNLLWGFSLGTAAYNQVNGFAVDPAGNCYLAMNFAGNIDVDPGPNVYNLVSQGLQDFIVVKFTGDGNLVWAHTFGGSASDLVYSMALNPDHSTLLLTGTFSDTVDFAPGIGVYNLYSQGNSDMFVLNLDTSGLLTWWVIQVGGNGLVLPHSMDINGNGEIALGGIFNDSIDFDPGPAVFLLSDTNSFSYFILKLNSFGNLQWAGKVAAESQMNTLSVCIDESGSIYTAGKFSSQNDFDPGPSTFILTSHGNTDIFITKIDNTGNLVWGYNIGNTYNNVTSGLVIDENNDLYLTGYFTGALNLNPIVNYTLSAYPLSTNSDVFYLKLDSAGSFISVIKYESVYPDFITSVYTDNKNNVYGAGYFRGTVDFDPGPLVNSLSSINTWNAFLHKMNNCPSISLSINTTQPICHNDTSFVEAVITGGVPPYTYLWNNGSSTPNLSGLPSGTYALYAHDQIMCQLFDTVEIIVPAPLNTVIYSIPTNSSTNCNGSIFYNAGGGIAPYTINWSSNSTINLCEGWYYVNLTDANGCIKNDSVYVNFIVSIDELNAEGVSVYPNPVNDVLIINSKIELGEIKIYDVVGKLIYHKLIKSNSAEIDVKAIDTGIYFIEVGAWRYKFVKD